MNVRQITIYASSWLTLQDIARKGIATSLSCKKDKELQNIILAMKIIEEKVANIYDETTKTS